MHTTHYTHTKTHQPHLIRKPRRNPARAATPPMLFTRDEVRALVAEMID